MCVSSKASSVDGIFLYQLRGKKDPQKAPKKFDRVNFVTTNFNALLKQNVHHILSKSRNFLS